MLARSNAPRCRNLSGKIVVIALGQYGLAEIGLKSERGFGCLPRLFT